MFELTTYNVAHDNKVAIFTQFWEFYWSLLGVENFRSYMVIIVLGKKMNIIEKDA